MLRRWLLTHWVRTALTVLMVIGLVLCLTDGQWVAVPGMLWITALIALLLGAAEGRFLRSPAVAIGLAALTGLVFSAAYHGQVLPEPGAGVHELAAEAGWAGGEAFRAARQALQPDTVSLPAPRPDMPEWRAARDRLALYAWNLQAGWPPQVSGAKLKMNATLLSSLLVFLAWLIAAMSAWVVIRGRSIWAALLPNLALQAASLYFAVAGWPYLVISLGAGLLLMSALSQRRIEGRWEDDSLPYGISTDRWFSASMIAMMAGLAIALAIQVTDPATRRWLDDTFSPKKPVAASQGTAGTRSSAPKPVPGVMPTQHLLGSGPELSKQTVMLVRTPGIAPAGFYWRAAAYNRYTGHGWLISAADPQTSESAQLWPSSAQPPENFALLRQTFQMESSTSQIYAAGRPVRLNQPATGVWLAPEASDLLSVNTVIMQSGYEVLSWVPVATPGELGKASTTYPDWVREGYMNLPDTLPARVKALAAKVTDGAKTPYDKALAIQNYLRGYTYTLDLDAPPTDRDVVDYFLFDLKRGYCDYYATAMVVMARSAGLPSRLAVGFATGQYDPQTETYRVSAADAHAWPEVYFPEYGWIAFEPTAGYPVPARGPASDWVSEADAASAANLQAFAAAPDAQAFKEPGWQVYAGIGGAALLVIGVAVILIRRRRSRGGSVEEVISGLFRDLQAAGQRIGVRLSPDQTPDEFLRALLAQVETHARQAPAWGGDWAERRARVGREAAVLVGLYTRLTYSDHHPALSAADAAWRTWPGLSRDLWLLWLAGLTRARQGDARPQEG